MHVQEVVAEAGRARQGMSTARQLRGAGIAAPQLSRAVTQGQVVRLRRRVYALEPLQPVPRFLVTDAGCAPEYVAQVRAALLSHGGSATAAGRTAAAVRGWGLLVEPARTLEIAVPHG